MSASVNGKINNRLVVALGASCQCTYQVRRFTGIERASYFDWLGIPHAALMEVLRRGFKDCFLKENLKLAREGSTVIDVATGVSYRHAFRWIPGHQLIEPTAIDQQYDELQQKYAALTERWFQDLESREVFFIRHDSPTVDELRELLQMLAFYCRRPFKLLVIANPAHAKNPINLHHPGLTIKYADTGRFAEFGWQGSNEVWDRVLGEHLEPAASAHARPLFARDLTSNELRRRAHGGK